MDTCIRGFSFMSDSKVDLVDLQYIEGGELERAWRTTRRERTKQREEKIWDNFVKEQDIVKDVCTDDPYQFIDEMPDSCLKEIMDSQLQKMTQDTDAENKNQVKDLLQHGNGDTFGDDNQHTCVVTFADDMDGSDDMFHIFDDDQSEEPGADEEVLNESISPAVTVRERDEKSETLPETAPNSPPTEMNILDKSPSSKSSENVTNVIESSIYCAKVKDLRMKINEELLALMTTLDRRDILRAEPEDIAKMIKRSAEFCSRFNRIYMYQLQRQIHDIKRNNSVSLPFAKHTQFQSQMVRIVSLHQNLLQSFQVFHKSFAQTCCVRESAGALGSLLAAVRDSTNLCLNVPPPKDFTAALDLYKDEMISTCDKVDEFINEYAIRCEEFLNSFETMNMGYPIKKTVKNKQKKKTIDLWNRNTAKNHDAGARLSMYSLDTMRLHLHPKASSTRDNHKSSSKMQQQVRNSNVATTNQKKGPGEKNSETPKSPKRSNRSRRPLMRDPHAGRPRAPRPSDETDIRTMVEAVETCTSSHISRENSPPSGAGRRNKLNTPRRTPVTPRPLHVPHGPHGTHATHVPHGPHTSHATFIHSPRARMSENPRKQLSPIRPKRDETTKQKRSSPKSPNAHIDSQSYTKPDEDLDDMSQVSQMTPVLKIQCAIKKNMEEEEGKRNKVAGSTIKGPSPVICQEEPRGKKATTDTHLKTMHKIQNAAKNEDEEAKHGECSRDSRESMPKSRSATTNMTSASERNRISSMSPEHGQVTRLVKQLCSGDASGAARVTGAKNAQLLFVNGSNSPRQPTTPQLLRILEETIQKKVPKPLKKPSAHNPDRFRLTFNIPEKTADTLFQYRTKYVQHMLTSTMYANSAVGKPWEVVGSVSETIIDEVLRGILKEMELRGLTQELLKSETC